MKATDRFSDRVQNYVKYRPSYPDAALDYLLQALPDAAQAACADIGSGTGLFARLLAGRVAMVYGVEPNAPMRAAAEAELREYRNFVSVAGRAEATGLAGASIDLVTAAQAFHWFDPAQFQAECRRILKPAGRAALIWNNRLVNTPFLESYERLLRAYATDYAEVNHQNITAADLHRFFAGGFETRTFPNQQRFDLDGLLGRLDSSSYAPKPGTRTFDDLRRELTAAFQAHQRAGRIDFNYETEVYCGRVSAA